MPTFRFLQKEGRNLPRSESEPKVKNRVTDWLEIQKYSDPGEEAYVIRRDLNSRKIEVSNSGDRAVKVKITTDPTSVVKWSDSTFPVHFQGDRGKPRGMDYVNPPGDSFPGVSFTIKPGESRFLGINPYEGPLQYLHILDPATDQPIGIPIETRHNTQIYVLRRGIQGWFFQPFQSSGFSSRY